MHLLAKFLATILVLATFSLGQSSESKESPAQPKKEEAPQDRPKRIRVSAEVAEKLLVKKVAPKYPPTDARITGKVVLHVIVGKEGDVQSVNLVSGHPMLVPPAIEAVRQWKYKPFLLNGEPIEVDTTVQIDVKINYQD